MKKKTKTKDKEKENFEILCYESDEGSICLEFGEAAISFSKKRFLEFAAKLNKISDTVLEKYLQSSDARQTAVSYRI